MPDAKKIIRTFWQALKLLALVSLVAMIVGAIYFQVPWKITGLLLIILLANLLLPKGKKRWFWAAAGIVIIALTVWVFLPENNEGWKPYTFDKELAVLEAKYKIPDEENAALIYGSLLESLKKEELEPNLPDPNAYYKIAYRKPWRSRDYPELAKWVEGQKQTIDTLLAASRKENCHFKIADGINQMQPLMERVATMRHLIYLLEASANNDAAENRINEAVDKYVATLRMAKHELQQTTMIELMVGMALDTLATSNINRFVVQENASEPQLYRIEQALGDIKYDWSKDWSRILENEKLLSKNLMLGIIYEVNSKGKVRLSRGPTATIRAQQPKADIPSMPFLIKKLTKAQTILTWFFMPSTPQEAGKIIDNGYEKYFAMAKPDFDWTKTPSKPTYPGRRILNFRYLVKFMAKIAEEPYYSIHDLYLRNKSNQRGSQLIIGLRRYKNKIGHWPESLDEIKELAPSETFIDPLNNGPFVYKVTEENFTLYSRGRNNIDENGRNEYGSKEKPGPDDWLIWPPRSEKTQKEVHNVKQ